MFTSYLFVIGQFVLKVISYWLTANNRKLINFLSTQFFNLRKCIESIFEEHFNWNDSNLNENKITVSKKVQKEMTRLMENALLKSHIPFLYKDASGTSSGTSGVDPGGIESIS